MFSLCFDDANQLQTDKKGVVRVAFVSNGGICGPLGNGNISSLGRTGTVGIAEFFGISFPANLAKLLVDHIAGFCLGFLPLACRFRSLLTASFLGNGICGGSLSLRFFRQSIFLCLFCGGIRNNRRSSLNRHNKGFVLIIPVTIGLHEPFTEAVCHLQEGLAFGDGSIVFVYSLVPNLAKGVENIHQILGQQAFAE